MTSREPVVLINSVVTLLEAVIAMAIAFGLDWTPEQKASVITVTVAVGVVVATVLSRSKVTPTADPRVD